MLVLRRTIVIENGNNSQEKKVSLHLAKSALEALRHNMECMFTGVEVIEWYSLQMCILKCSLRYRLAMAHHFHPNLEARLAVVHPISVGTTWVAQWVVAAANLELVIYQVQGLAPTHSQEAEDLLLPAFSRVAHHRLCIAWA